MSKYGHVLNNFSFFNLIEAWNYNNVRWYAVNSSNMTCKSLTAKNLYSTYDNLEGVKGIYENSKNIFVTVGNDSAETVKGKLRATYSYANMGKASYIQEEKFMNLWVALESLCRTDTYDNIITNVLEIVPPALCKRYIYRLVRNYYEDCHRCGINLTFSTLQISAHQSRREIVKELIGILVDDALFDELKTKCRVNDLLYNRTLALRNLLTDVNKLSGAIEKHSINVKRQISRLYRLRNKIAHSAFNEEGSLIRYIEHLEGYLSGLVAEVIMCSVDNNEAEMDAVLELIKENYRAFTEIIAANKKTGSDVLLNGLMKTGVIVLVPKMG